MGAKVAQLCGCEKRDVSRNLSLRWLSDKTSVGTAGCAAHHAADLELRRGERRVHASTADDLPEMRGRARPEQVGAALVVFTAGGRRELARIVGEIDPDNILTTAFRGQIRKYAHGERIRGPRNGGK